MNRVLSLAALALVTLITTAAKPAEVTNWRIDKDHSNIGFSVRHLMVSDITGQFSNFKGVTQINEEDLSKSFVEVEIELSSIDTNNKKRDEHLMSKDFFDIKKNPTMVFRSEKFIHDKQQKILIYGNLTLHGVTNPVTLKISEFTDAVKDPWGMTRRGVKAVAAINRTHFGLKWNKTLEAGGVLVGEEVRISLQIELVKKD